MRHFQQTSALGVEDSTRQAACAIRCCAAKPPRQLVRRSPRRSGAALSTERQRKQINQQGSKPAGKKTAAMLPDQRLQRFGRDAPRLSASLALENPQLL